jgi:two-component system LytT family response regulator
MEPTFKCLIIDDEKPAHLVIKSHIENSKNLEFIESAYNGKEGLQILKNRDIDIIFLDIDMPIMNGIEFIQSLENKPLIIITSAHHNFAFEAYQNDVIDYLLKPISFTRFTKAIEKAKQIYVYENRKQNNLNQLKLEGVENKLIISEIYYIQSIGNYIKIFVEETNKPIIVYLSLKSFLEKIKNDYFIQTHKSFIINTNKIKKVEKDKLILSNSTLIPIGRKYKILLEKFQ